jgi:hypothetical protein
MPRRAQPRRARLRTPLRAVQPMLERLDNGLGVEVAHHPVARDRPDRVVQVLAAGDVDELRLGLGELGELAVDLERLRLEEESEATRGRGDRALDLGAVGGVGHVLEQSLWRVGVDHWVNHGHE